MDPQEIQDELKENRDSMRTVQANIERLLLKQDESSQKLLEHFLKEKESLLAQKQTLLAQKQTLLEQKLQHMKMETAQIETQQQVDMEKAVRRAFENMAPFQQRPDYTPKKGTSSTTLSQVWATNYADHVSNASSCFIKPQEEEFDYTASMSILDNLENVKNESDQHRLFISLLKSLAGEEDTSAFVDKIEVCYNGRVYHTHRTNYIKDGANRLQPDFAYHMTTDVSNIFECGFLFELQIGAYDNDHKAKIALYNEAVLNLNPIRKMIISVLTNLRTIELFKTERKDTEKKFYKYKHAISSVAFDLSGLKILHYALKNPELMGYFRPPSIQIDSTVYVIDRYLGSGANSRVYRTLEKTDVVKIYKEKPISCIKEERDMYLKLDGVDGTQQIRGYDEQNRALILYPCGHRLDNDPSLFAIRNINELEQILSIMSRLRERNIVHRDIGPQHFFFTQSFLHEPRTVLLIDFSSAVDKDAQNVFYTGSTFFAANEIYAGFLEGRKYQPSFRHDMESFFKVFLYFLFSSFRIKIDSFIQAATNKYGSSLLEKRCMARETLDMWTSVESVMAKHLPKLSELLNEIRMPELDFELINSNFLQAYKDFSFV